MRLPSQIALLLLIVTLAGCTPRTSDLPAESERAVQPAATPPTGSAGYPWWNDTVFYQIFVRSFHDSDGDGVGDLAGLIERLDYLNDGDPTTTSDLGVTGIWLMPIHPSPSYHGYDVTDYYAINPQYGTLEQFRQLISEAHRRGMRVMIDFVLNHTSDRHPWFQASRDPASPYRDWYVWAPRGEAPGPRWRVANSGFYYGYFTDQMPDLNYHNPEVTEAMYEVARFWLQEVGVDGLRLDAAKYLLEEGSVYQNAESTYAWYRDFRSFYKAVKPEALTVAEVWDQVNPASVAAYTQGDQLDLAFNFRLAEVMLTAARTGRAEALQRTMLSDSTMFRPLQFATFLANHDQSRAISRLQNRIANAQVAAALLLTAPGVPFIYYGEEIGMTGVQQTGDRQMRTPMQWSAEQNAGFTTGRPWFPPNADYATGRNVADQRGDPTSLLSSYRELIRLRNEHVALRVGQPILLETGHPAVYALLRADATETLLIVINLGSEPVGEYALDVATGPLAGSYQLVALLAPGEGATLQATAQGGFTAYRPLAELPPQQAMIWQLQPQK